MATLALTRFSLGILTTCCLQLFMACGASNSTAPRDAATDGEASSSTTVDGGSEDGAPAGPEAETGVDGSHPTPDSGDSTTPPGGCPSGRGPAMVAIGVSDAATTLCVDTTEVTNAQYALFLTANPTPPQQTGTCSGVNVSYSPDTGSGCAGMYDPQARGDYPVVCVDWCDAIAYCAWTGKRLCANADGSPVGSLADAAWTLACSNNGTTGYAYGPVYEFNYCNDSAYAADAGLIPVASDTNCHGDVPPFLSIFDLQGNADEFQDNGCSSGACLFMGGSFEDSRPSCAPLGRTTTVQGYQPSIGFRCCANF